jgi:hypothetical protein
MHKIKTLILVSNAHVFKKNNMSQFTHIHAHEIMHLHTHEIMNDSTQAQRLIKVFNSPKSNIKTRF